MRIPAERLYLNNAILTLREICDHLDVRSERACQIVLSLEEALLNAIEHAYVGETGLIDLQFSVEGSEFIVVVEDYGCGISRQKELDLLTNEEILCDRGRGLFILNGMPDKTILQTNIGKGTRATMLFNLTLP